ncbi:MAG: hypothetical protein PW788_15990 [Micavibrio sp.]|nr:hypothetical protein [Micavibrio sp.]
MFGERIGFVENAEKSWDAMATASPTRTKYSMVTPISTKSSTPTVQVPTP